MPISLQNLSNISSLDQLRLSSDRQLTQRTGLGPFFRKVGDAFLRLSQSGRIAIAERNSRLMDVFRETVRNTAGAAPQQEMQDLRARLTTVENTLRRFALNSKSAALTSAITTLRSDSRFKALPEGMKAKLKNAFTATANKVSPKLWNSRFESLKCYFFGKAPAAFDLKNGVKEYMNDLLNNERDGFLSTDQQAKVKEDGMHASFINDTRRRIIKSFNDKPTPSRTEKTEEEIVQHCVDKLRATLSKKQENILPFVSMMASQAGLGASKNFLPHLSGLAEIAFDNLTDAGLIQLGNTHGLHVKFDGSSLTIRSVFEQNFVTEDDIAARTPTLICKGEISMVIDLKAEPKAMMVDGKPVYVPKFHLTDASLRMERNDT